MASNLLMALAFSLALVPQLSEAQTAGDLPSARVMKNVPGGHTVRFKAEAGRTVMLFEPPLPATDGAIYGAMLEAIQVLHAGDTGAYVGSKLYLQPLPNGTNAIAMDGAPYVYFVVPVKTEDRRLLGASFWRTKR